MQAITPHLQSTCFVNMETAVFKVAEQEDKVKLFFEHKLVSADLEKTQVTFTR